MNHELAFRIMVVQAPEGVDLRLQKGKTELVAPTRVSAGQISFDFFLRAVGDPAAGPPNLRGPFAQGPPASRFVYVKSGTLAGQVDSCWTRRAKVPLSGVTWELIEQASVSPGSVLEDRIAGTAKDGGPACATVPLLDGGWRVAPL